MKRTAAEAFPTISEAPSGPKWAPICMDMNQSGHTEMIANPLQLTDTLSLEVLLQNSSPKLWYNYSSSSTRAARQCQQNPMLKQLLWRITPATMNQFLNHVDTKTVHQIQIRCQRLGNGKELHWLSEFTNLSKLVLTHRTQSKNNHVTDFAFLYNLTGLRILHIDGVDQVLDLSPLPLCFNLTDLQLSGFMHLERLSSLHTLTNLRSLILREDSSQMKLMDISTLGRLTNLENLEIVLGYSGPSDIYDIDVLSSLTNLKNLRLRHFWNVTDLTPLSNLLQLRHLSLIFISWYSAIKGVESLQVLRNIEFFQMATGNGTRWFFNQPRGVYLDDS